MARTRIKVFQNIFLILASLLSSLCFFELSSRAFLKPSNRCYGSLFKKDLPPFKIPIGDQFHENFDEPLDGVVIQGKKMTKGDFWGILIEEPTLGYAPKENAVSLNGWWQSNNVGARSRTDTSQSVEPGKKRVLIFGDSFTNCSRVHQEDAWPFLMNQDAENEGIEFLNFGVDGYGMGQCLLRFENLKSKIDYDVVALVLSPSADMLRDINVLRQLQGWENYPLMPRFILEGEVLRLIPSPYRNYGELQAENADHASDVLKKHLSTYDRLYFKMKYESPPWVGRLISYKLLAKAIYQFQSGSLIEGVLKKDSEARIVIQKIAGKMDEELRRVDKKFVMIFLPGNEDLENYYQSQQWAADYDDMVASIRKEGIATVDLMRDLMQARGELDKAYDGWHYGPKTNHRISDLLRKHLKESRVL